MLIQNILQDLVLVRNFNGKNSLSQKKKTFSSIIKFTKGEVLRFFDLDYRSRLNVNTQILKKIHLEFKEPLTVSQFWDLNDRILDCNGARSRQEKLNLLTKIMSGVSDKTRFLLIEYYELGGLRIGISEKSIVKVIRADFSRSGLRKACFRGGLPSGSLSFFRE